MANACARELLSAQFQDWLRGEFSESALPFVDLQSAALRWVKEVGTFVAGTGACVYAECLICGQWPKVLEDGRIAKDQNEPDCGRGHVGIQNIGEFPETTNSGK